MTSFVDVTEHTRATELALHRALHDPLTGAVNRAGLGEILLRVAARAPRVGATMAVAFCDLDDFKDVNDRYGHAAGDEVLRAVTERVTHATRAEDVVARLGGDEFAVVLVSVDGLAGALRAAEKIREAVRAPVVVSTGTVTPTMSVGVALFTGVDALDDTMQRADEAMYLAKQGGRDRVATLDPV
ncbi:MAG: GGDEF domain-containing protein [Actinomycetota bacterium]